VFPAPVQSEDESAPAIAMGGGSMPSITRNDNCFSPTTSGAATVNGHRKTHRCHLTRCVNSSLDGVIVHHVGLHENGITVELSGQRLSAVFSEVSDDDLGASGDEATHGCLTESTGSTGDDCGSTLDVHLYSPLAAFRPPCHESLRPLPWVK
jgi:hypothetical protein